VLAEDQRSGDRHARIIVGSADRLLSGKGPGHLDPTQVRRVRSGRVFGPWCCPRGRPADGRGDRRGRAFRRCPAYFAGAFLRSLRDALRWRDHAPGSQWQSVDHTQVPDGQLYPSCLAGSPYGLALARVKPQEGPLVPELRHPRPAQATEWMFVFRLRASG
jgi:hypothetical protein